MPVRLREEIQAVLRRGGSQLNACQLDSSGWKGRRSAPETPDGWVFANPETLKPRELRALGWRGVRVGRRTLPLSTPRYGSYSGEVRLHKQREVLRLLETLKNGAHLGVRESRSGSEIPACDEPESTDATHGRPRAIAGIVANN